MFRELLRIIVAFVVFVSFVVSSGAQTNPASFSGKHLKRIVVRNATVVDGSGKPASGPYDIVLEDGLITEIVAFDPVAVKEGRAKRPQPGELEIDATGKFVLPGLINLHAHMQDERGGVPMPVEYCAKLWLACGITTIREVASSKKTLQWRADSAAGRLAAPRIFAYGVFQADPTPKSVDEARARIREIKEAGYDGVKLFGIDRDLMQAMMDEAHKLGLRVAHHVGVEETNAWDDIQVRHDEHRALVRHSRRGDRQRTAKFSIGL